MPDDLIIDSLRVRANEATMREKHAHAVRVAHSEPEYPLKTVSYADFPGRNSTGSVI